MAGKGRGRGKYTFNLESIGISKNETLPSSSLTPPPLFPPLPVKSVPFTPSKSDHYNYLYDVKQELSSAFKSSKYFLVPPKVNLGIQRYSDKFAASNDSPSKQNGDSLVKWKLMPEGLKLKSKVKKSPKSKQTDNNKIEEILKKLDENEEVEEKDKEKESVKDESEVDDEDDDAGEKGDDEDEQNEEEENDYLNTYFDNGEENEPDSDEYEDGPTY